MSHPTHSPKQLLRADLVLVLVTLLAAAGWLFSKEALAGLPPLLFMGLRFLAGGSLLLLPSLRAMARFSKEQWRASMLVGMLMGSAMSIWIFGLAHTSSLGEGAFITSLAVVIVPLVNWFIFKEKLSKAAWIALPLAILGMALLSLRHGFTLEQSQVYFFCAALLLSVTFILNSRAAAKTPALALSTIQLLWVGVICLSLSFFLETWPSQVDSSIWGWLFLSFTLATAARFSLQTYAQGISPTSHAAVIMILEPVWTAIFAAIWFAERMSFAQFLGCAFIALALLVNRLKFLQHRV